MTAAEKAAALTEINIEIDALAQRMSSMKETRPTAYAAAQVQYDGLVARRAEIEAMETIEVVEQEAEPVT